MIRIQTMCIKLYLSEDEMFLIFQRFSVIELINFRLRKTDTEPVDNADDLIYG